MVCEKCGKEMIKVGVLSETELQDLYFVNEQCNTAYQALNRDVINEMKFEDGQVFEYFRAAYEALAKGRFLSAMFHRDLKKRLNISKDVYIDEISGEVFIHPDGDEGGN